MAAVAVVEKTNPIVLLADAVNQLAMIVEGIAFYTAQHGYTDVTYPRRRRWVEDTQKIRENISELIPE